MVRLLERNSSRPTRFPFMVESSSIAIVDGNLVPKETDISFKILILS